MKQMAWIIICTCLCISSSAYDAQASHYMSLRSGEVNMRVGPGKIYPILWHYTRRGLPVEVIGKHMEWLQVKDAEGETGWMYYRLLSNVRTVMTTTDNVLLYSHPDNNSAVTARIMRNKVMIPQRCRIGWCEVAISHRDALIRGWIRKHYLWGVDASELFEK